MCCALLTGRMQHQQQTINRPVSTTHSLSLSLCNLHTHSLSSEKNGEEDENLRTIDDFYPPVLVMLTTMFIVYYTRQARDPALVLPPCFITHLLYCSMA